MPIKYKRVCNLCGKYYEGFGKYFCSLKCACNTIESKEKTRQRFVGKHTSTEFKKGHINWNTGLMGKDSPTWKGGEKIATVRKHHKRRNLGSISLNNPIEDFVAHHINTQCVLFVPEWINKSCYHNVHTNYNMGYVNAIALFWLCYTEEINNCVEI